MSDGIACLFSKSVVPLIALLSLLGFATHAGARQEWKPVPGSIMTRWAKSVDPSAPLPEYPRPTLVRDRWQNLNGLWDYAILGQDAATTDSWAGKILVPFPIESALSGVKKMVGPEQTLHYRRTFKVPTAWDNSRVVLHFGAVDWHCKVRVNGKPVGEHRGGYDPFSFDITDVLKPGAENEIVVVVMDPTNKGGQPRGKQWDKPRGIWYTPTTGIWQTVWIEPVAATGHVKSVRFEPNLNEGWVDVTTTVGGAGASDGCVIEVRDGDAVVASGTFPAGKAARLNVPSPKAWSPRSPFLYDVTIKVKQGANVVDTVTSYFAFRDIKVAKDSLGVNRLMLNGKPTFMYGPLDQGFWPDGLYTQPSDEALKFDIDAVIKMGGNMLRKHVKVESERFYYWCDRMGVMVWQDMPSPFFLRTEQDGTPEGDFPRLTSEWKENFAKEWSAIIDANREHPSIVMWVPFNEGWGQNDLEWCKSMVLKTKEWDPTRLVNNASGWTDMHIGDTSDIHIYPGPATPPVEEHRVAVLGEFGGLGLPIEGHTWVQKDNWGYVSYKNKDELTKAYLDQMNQLPMLIAEGLCAAVYTQTTDVEIECNGWLTYDREVWKIDPARARETMERALANPPKGVRTVVSRAGQKDGAGEWSYTTTKPAAAWNTPGFATDAAWKTGKGGFGTRGTPSAIVGTEWNTSDIWIRREFKAPAMPSFGLMLSIHHDEDAEVFINGVPAASLTKYASAYKAVPIAEAALAAIKWGATNTLAIHCHQTAGGQYIDCGLIELIHDAPASKPGASSSMLLMGPPEEAATRPREELANYETRTLAGFTLKVNKEFIASAPELLDRTLLHLHADLDQIVNFLPKPACDALRGVTIWVERRGSTAMGRGGRGMCCHWSPAWLATNGLLTEKAGGVEIINADDFLTWRRDQPYMTFHELAHAFHWRLAKLDPEIEAAFQHAKDAKRYDEVARNSLPTGKTERAYAITNSHEYFAELSEAYFALNDFYPYTRRQLADLDPEGLKLMERVWKLSASEIAANTASREPAPTSSPAAPRTERKRK